MHDRPTEVVVELESFEHERTGEQATHGVGELAVAFHAIGEVGAHELELLVGACLGLLGEREQFAGHMLGDPIALLGVGVMPDGR